MPSYISPDVWMGFATLSFFIHAETSLPLSLVISFSNDYYMVDATVSIIGIELVPIAPIDFTDAAERAEANPDDRSLAIMSESDPFVDDDNDDTTETQPWNLDFLIIPSIITAIALIFALIAFGIRRVQFKKHITKGHTSYARDNAPVTEEEIKTLKSKRAPKSK